ncbi:ef hand family protein [Stylonychia lemnae]|uniref:Ef hand family protein n=1 Tax=Stylonychia lemnae TaxID=5949 RepID=A0A078A1F3_STYLE|nr:ef hand family protein [Stylonychia lemnae]|eukprot:CDW75672.1 ef hand family protein [Stylonychia lemnae]
MLGYSSEKKLLALFEAIRDGEQYQESLRQRLCSKPGFAPYSAFMRIDRDGDEKLRTTEILDFFSDNREYTIRFSDCEQLIKYYDLDRDLCLSYQEFQQVILPCEDNGLRNLALGRAPFRVPRYEKLPVDMEYQLNSLMYSEIKFLRKLQDLRQDLALSYDFSTYAAFRTVDRYNYGAIDADSLKTFYKLNNKFLSDKESIAIVRRIDTDGDSKISYSEFSDFINNQLDKSALLYEAPKKLSESQANYGFKNDQSLLIRENNATPLKPAAQKKRSQTTEKKKRNQVQFERENEQINEENQEEEEEEAQPENQNDQSQEKIEAKNEESQEQEEENNNFQTPSKKNDDQNDNGLQFKSELKTAEKSDLDQSPDQNQSQMNKSELSVEKSRPSYSNYRVVNLIEDVLRLEKQLENSKQILALKSDFNLFDGFKVFDNLGLGYINELDFKKALSEIGIYATYDEVSLFFKRYDTDRDGRLRFSEFINALLPNDHYHASLVNRRSSNLVRSIQRDDCFTFSTRLQFQDLFRTHLSVERQLDLIRNKEKYISSSTFDQLDLNKDGRVTRFEVQKWLEDSRIYANQNDLDLLMKKFDSDKDGRISYSELADELRPRNPVY